MLVNIMGSYIFVVCACECTIKSKNIVKNKHAYEFDIIEIIKTR